MPAIGPTPENNWKRELIPDREYPRVKSEMFQKLPATFPGSAIILAPTKKTIIIVGVPQKGVGKQSSITAFDFGPISSDFLSLFSPLLPLSLPLIGSET